MPCIFCILVPFKNTLKFKYDVSVSRHNFRKFGDEFNLKGDGVIGMGMIHMLKNLNL